MRLSDHPERQVKKGVKDRPPGKKMARWGDQQKLETVQAYITLGSMAKAGAAIGVPLETVKLWRRSEWWKNLEDEMRLDDNVELGAKLRKIVERSLTEVEDRLENGNHMYDQKTGTLVRVPVNVKDASKVALDAMATRQILEKRPHDNAKEDIVENKLKALAERFALMAANKFQEIKDEARTVDMVVDALPYAENDEEDDDDYYGPDDEDEPLEVIPDVDFADHVGVGQVKLFKKEK